MNISKEQLAEMLRNETNRDVTHILDMISLYHCLRVD